jgi:hypothetical protein
MPGPVVKGAPYSAEAITEMTQMFPDGNRIRQSSHVRVFRDSEGRTRREQSLNSIGAFAANTGLPNVVFINDPIAGVNYALNPAERVANKSTWERRDWDRGGGRQDGRKEGGEREGKRENPNVKRESLGKQVIEGVQAEGTRTTMTIPAGQIGNELPIQIVSETWYSPELQTVVLSKRSDPRQGEVVFRLVNVSRADQPRSLFEVPADYSISKNRGGREGRF